MILRLGFVDLVDRIANSIRVQPVAILESSEPFGRAPPKSSCIPLSQYKSQVVCCGERLHVTVFRKFASLSLERASHCTTKPYFEDVSKDSCVERSLASSSRVEFSPYPFHPP